MSKFDFSNISNSFRILTNEKIESIFSGAIHVLEKTGVRVEDENALKVFADGGAEVDFQNRKVRIPEHLVKDSIAKTPSEIKLWYRTGKEAVTIGGRNTVFLPGSSAVKILDAETLQARKPISSDQADLAKLVDALPCISVNSGPLVVSDVPPELCDRYRMYPVLKNSIKPIITGAYSVDGLIDMIEMVKIVMGDDSTKKPIFSNMSCPTSPLMLGSLICRAVMICAREGIPVTIIPAPISGGTAPATLAGTLVIAACEALSTIVLGQIVNPGSAFIYGGSPGIMEMRYGTMVLGAIETIMMNCAHNEIGKYLGIPTHGYLGLSDSKIVDAQAGIESALGIIFAVLTEVNAVSGPGMLEFESCQSLEKLVIDNEICKIALRLKEGIKVDNETLALEVISNVGPGGEFLTKKHTHEWFKKEQILPTNVIDRVVREKWTELGCKDTAQRAREIAKKLIKEHKPEPLPKTVEEKLDDLIHKLHTKYK
ncbi:MAG: trimethylamine methyltransferase family protein [Candidatus Aenigmatarchaeota archaeon]